MKGEIQMETTLHFAQNADAGTEESYLRNLPLLKLLAKENIEADDWSVLLAATPNNEDKLLWCLGYTGTLCALEDINMVVYCGGFSNSDVLGSAKGWAGSFLFNPKAKAALDNFYAREDTLSLGVCNGCQLMMELGLITPEDKKKGKMLHNDSHKFESNFLGVTVPMNRSVMFGSLSGSKLGIWVAHGEGKFSLPYPEDHYNVVLKYSYDEYPGNPNGSDYSVAGIASQDGRHLAMMPHLERACFPWENAYYPLDRKEEDQITPWMEAFVNARKWVEANRKK